MASVIPGARAGVKAFEKTLDRGAMERAAEAARIAPNRVSDDGLDLSKVEVLSIKDARRPGDENRGLIFVKEPQCIFSKLFNQFESGTIGAFSDVASKQRAVPALRFDHWNPRGNNFVKFDGVEADGITLIDRKTALTIHVKQVQSLQRVSTALKQNSGYKIVYEFPSQKAADRAMDIFIEQCITNITVGVAQ